MMDLWATKTTLEQEDEEARRLVRQAPKVKPPRHDRRRERMDTSRDPDIDDDPDLKKDPDRSKNYKDIAGSVARRFLAEVADRIKVRHRETGKVVQVSPETLREEGGKYEKIEEGEDDATPADAPDPKDSSPEEKPRPKAEEPRAYEGTHADGEAIRALARNDKELAKGFRNLADPNSDAAKAAEERPDLLLTDVFHRSVFPGLKFPEGVETVGDLVKALRARAPKETPKKTAPKKTPKAAPQEETPQAAPEEAPKEEPTAPQEAPKTPGEALDRAPTETTPPAETPTVAPTEAAPPAEKPTAPEDSPKEPAKKPGKKKPGKPPEEDGTSPEEAMEEPSEAEKAGIKPPARRAASDAERMEAASLIMDTFPEEVATDLLSKNLHPDDVNQLVNTFHASQQLAVKDPAGFSERMADFYEPSFDRVAPPKKGKNAEGQLVPFKELSPEEQSEAMRQHQVQVTALSLGAKKALTSALSLPSWTGRPRVAPELAGALASFMLLKGNEAAAERMSEQMFSTALTGSSWAKVDPDSIKQLGSKLTPAARKLSTAYFEAADYHEAKRKFLGSSSEQVSERSKPREIMQALRGAKAFFADQAKKYGTDTHRASALFQVRVLDRLRAVAPERYADVRKLIAHDQKRDYDKQKSKWDKDVWAWEARKQAWEAKNGPYRQPFKEPRPVEPPKPPLYHLAEDAKEARRNAETALDEVQGRTKTASLIAERFISTYSGPHAMGRGSDKTGVYHGIDPQEQYPGPYAGWQQAHQRDLGESDFKAILGGAKDWLKTEVLAVPIQGSTRDSQLRAALDLAIRDSKYAGQIQPTTYNMLLARLAGVPTPGPGQTLLTIREAKSTFGAPQKGTPMKPSQQLRMMSASLADTNPKVAFDLLDLATRLDAAPAVPAPVPVVAATKVADDRFQKLRAVVIRTAASDAAAKRVLLPVLQEIKNLG